MAGRGQALGAWVEASRFGRLGFTYHICDTIYMYEEPGLWPLNMPCMRRCSMLLLPVPSQPSCPPEARPTSRCWSDSAERELYGKEHSLLGSRASEQRTLTLEDTQGV